MPIPKQRKDETQPQFMERCMSDSMMLDEYPDRHQRAAVCRTGIGFTSQKFAKSLTAEIFAAGKWNGMSFTLDDLSKIVKSFKTLADVHRVPLKFGHNDNQPMTDGQPALGWVEDVYVDQGKDGKPKLMARFADMPQVVFDAIKKKLYRKVSIELDMDVSHPRGRFDYVLSGVALLGADIPAVSVLADLTAYMSRDSMVAGKRAVFTAISTPEKEGATVSDELKAQLAEMRAELKGLQEKNANLEAEKASFAKQESERKEAEAKAKVETARGQFSKMLDDAVKENRILPAQREAFSKVLRLEDDAAVTALKAEDVESLIGSVGGPAAKFSKDSAKQQSSERAGADAGSVLTAKAREIQNANPGLTFSRALERAQAADPELAKQAFAEE